MKQITELTEKEILALTDEQLDTMVKYKMAESGIKILKYPEPVEYLPLPAKDFKLFKIDGFDKMFINREDAEKVSAILIQIKEANSMAVNDYINWGTDTNFAKKFTSEHYSYTTFGEVKEVFTYHEKTMRDSQSIVEENKVLKTAYDEAVKEYKEADEAASDIKSLIYGTYNEVVKKYQHMEEMKGQYAYYVRLAEGYTKVAMDFLKAAYKIDDQTEYYVQGLEMPIVDEKLVVNE